MPSKSSKLIIFDLDGTLIDVLRFHAASLEYAIREVWDIPLNLPAEKRLGLPQRATLRNVGVFEGLGSEQIEAGMSRAMKTMTAYMEANLPADLAPFLLPGAVDLLKALTERQDVYLVLATGTLGPTADIILERSSLKAFIPVGAFGHEVSSRTELVKLARERALEYHGLHEANVEAVTIGDAPADILAGREIGALTVAVPTGWTSKQDLLDERPDLLLDDFVDTNVCVQAILDLSESK